MNRWKILMRRLPTSSLSRRNFSGFEEAQKAHRARLEMMQQERIVDPNAKVKRFHMRALWTPMLMKYWVPLFICFAGMIAVSDNLTLKKSQEKREHLRSQGFGDQNQVLPGGVTLSDRNRYMQEHIDRVIHGEDTWKVAEELQQRYKEEQEMKQRLQRDNPAMTPMTQSTASMARQSKLKR
eukprot:493158_1